MAFVPLAGEDPRTLPALARRAAAEHGDRVVAAFPEGGVRYGELVDRMDGFAGALQALGVRAGDRVAVVMASRIEWVDVWFGTCALGAVEVPVNHDLTGPLLGHCLADCGAEIAVVEDRFLDAVLSCLGQAHRIRTIVVVGDVPATAPPGIALLAYDALDRPVPSLPEIAPGDAAAIMYTSGTTGNAKGVVLPHGYFIHFGVQKARHMRTTAEDRIYNVYPMFNASGQCEAVMAAMAVGASVYTAPRFSASRFWEDIRREGCTEFVYMGGILSILAKAEPHPGDADNPIRAAYGIPTPPHLHRAFEARFDLRLVELYGSTEANIVTYNPYDDRRVGSCGLPTAGFEIRVVDEDGRDLPPGEVGEILVRPTVPHTTMTEYWNLPERTAEAWRGGWYHTGDLVRRDADGYVYFESRRAEAIRHRGYMVNPSIIEAAVDAAPEVLESAVVGIPDPEFGEEAILACVVPAAGAAVDLEALAVRCAGELPPWMVPGFWEICDALPKTPTQKVAKAQLRDRGVTPATVDLTDLVRSRARAAAGRAPA
jgi:carnitine-CoA ligase